MAVIKVSTIQRWVGLSTDTKPAAPDYSGSTFYEYDTGRTYVWDGTAWQIMPIHILNVQGGAYTIQDLMEEFLAMLDLARSPQSGSTTMDGTELTLYEETDVHPFAFFPGWIDFTGVNAGGGEDTTIKFYVKTVSGGTYRLVWSALYLVAGVPVPACVMVPNADDSRDIGNILHNMYGIKITAQQALVGGGWNALPCEWYDGKRGG